MTEDAEKFGNMEELLTRGFLNLLCTHTHPTPLGMDKALPLPQLVFTNIRVNLKLSALL